MAARKTRSAVGPIQIQPKAESRTSVRTTSGSFEVFQATSHIAHQALQRLRKAAERLERLAASRASSMPAVSAEPTHASSSSQT